MISTSDAMFSWTANAGALTSDTSPGALTGYAGASVGPADFSATGLPSILQGIGQRQNPFLHGSFGAGIINPVMPSRREIRPLANNNKEVVELLFDRLVDLKVATHKVAMHLEQGWRAGLFRQLDNLLEEDAWDLADALPTAGAYMTLLRVITDLKPTSPPRLGATEDGNILAAWLSPPDRVTIHCAPDDVVRWTASAGISRAAGITNAVGLKNALAPYKPDRWFAVAHDLRS